MIHLNHHNTHPFACPIQIEAFNSLGSDTHDDDQLHCLEARILHNPQTKENPDNMMATVFNAMKNNLKRVCGQ